MSNQHKIIGTDHATLDKAYKIAVVHGLYRVSAAIRKIEVSKSPLGTAHTDGINIVFDRGFMEGVSARDALFIAAHEYYHIVYDHIRRGRAKGFDPVLYNVAGDLIINTHLTEVVGLEKPSDNIGGIFRDNPLFDGMPDKFNTSEKVYSWLVENNKNPNASDLMGDLVFSDEGLTQEDEQQIAAHQRLEEKDARDAKNRGEKYSREIFDVLGHKTADGESDWIDILTALKIESGRLVRRQIERNYSRPPRRREPKGVILPAARHTVQTPRVDVYIDVSGSMGEDPLTIFQGLKSILSAMSVYRPRFYTFNTGIKMVDIKSDRFSIGGGTDIKKVLLKIREDRADLAIVITDCQDNISPKDFEHNTVVVSNNETFADFITKDWQRVKKTNKRRKT